jgi:hypothetical protein
MKNSNLCNKYRHNTVFHDEGVSSAVITQAKKVMHDFYTIFFLQLCAIRKTINTRTRI